MITLRTLAGHRRVRSLLSSAIARGSVPPVLLVTGPSGVGKYRLAAAAASAINCLEPVRDVDGLPIDACGTCRSCDRIARGLHVDVLTVEPDETGAIKIDVIRDVLDRTGFRPFEGRRRVVILRDADAMQGPPQNALLKSLEEPPPGTMLILTTAIPGSLLPTVRSRCMTLRLGRLTEDEVAEVLVRDHELPAEDARAAAAIADGSVGAALAMTSDDLGELRALALSLLKSADGGRGLKRRLDAAAAVVGAGRQERDRREVARVLRFVRSMLRDIELLHAGADERLLANPSLLTDLRRLERGFAGRARGRFPDLDAAIAALARNAGIKVVADWVAVRL